MNVRRLLPRDAIPSIDSPTFDAAYFGDPDDEVVVVEPERGPARAYPLRVLHYHEVVNDVVGTGDVDPGGRGVEGADGVVGVDERENGGTDGDGGIDEREDRGTDGDGGIDEREDRGTDGEGMAGGPGHRGTDGDGTAGRTGRPIAVTWCPICASAVVYDRTVDGDVLEFGVSGKLADDALVLYDRRDGSEWKQSSGVAIGGDHDGERLEVLPAGLMAYRRFQAAHPDGVVLDPAGSDTQVGDAEAARRYYDPEPYRHYFDGDGFGYEAIKGRPPAREWDRDDLPAKAVVLGLGEGNAAVGVPYPVVVERGGVVEVAVGGRRFLVVATDEAFHAFDVPDFPIEATDDGRLAGDGTTWDPATGEGEDGRRLARVPARRLYAFAWQDDHGPGSFYGV